MTTRTRRARLGGMLAVALGALALLALPALSAAKHGSDDSDYRQNAGTVASYDSESGELTIDLNAGGTTTALVTDETRIICVGVKRGGHRHHHNRGRGRGHEGEDSASSSRRSGKKARRGEVRRRGANCTDEALAEGAVIRKARTDSEEGVEEFTKILVEKAKTASGGPCDDDESDDDHSGDDDGTPDQGPGDV